MRFYNFDWDASNIEHVARHRVAPHEAEAVCRGQTVIQRGRHGSYLVYGRTEAGRYLLVVIRSLGRGLARIITARQMTSREQRFYHGRH